MFRTKQGFASGEKRKYLNELQMEMASSYPNWLRELGTDMKFVEVWKDLIKLRLKGYEKDFEEYKEELPDPQGANPWISVIPIGCHHHVSKGKTDEKDPLFLYLVKWMKELAVMASKNVV